MESSLKLDATELMYNMEMAEDPVAPSLGRLLGSLSEQCSDVGSAYAARRSFNKPKVQTGVLHFCLFAHLFLCF